MLRSHRIGGIPPRQLGLTTKQYCLSRKPTKGGRGKRVLKTLWALITAVRLGEQLRHTKQGAPDGQILSRMRACVLPLAPADTPDLLQTKTFQSVWMVALQLPPPRPNTGLASNLPLSPAEMHGAWGQEAEVGSGFPTSGLSLPAPLVWSDACWLPPSFLAQLVTP